MRGMNSASVDLIYLDPPFNSKKNYAAPIGSKAAGSAFKDSWTWNDVDRVWLALLERQRMKGMAQAAGLVANYAGAQLTLSDARDVDTSEALYAVIEAARLSHSSSMAAYISMMAQRLQEMKRLLKPTGSIYLHCDPTASHCLRQLMDTVFDKANYRNEIVWCYAPSGRAPKYGFHRKHDTIIYYGRTDTGTFNHQFSEMNPTTKATYSKVDSDGRYYKQSPGGRSYLDQQKGRPVPSWWKDIPSFGTATASPERTGYPTQKPLGLLSRIIRASSNEGDIVFDPFCGCATTCVSAEQLGRQWVGIDLSEKAAELVRMRLQDAADKHGGVRLSLDDVVHRTDLPRRTDMGKLPPYAAHKDLLYGHQGGDCGGCGVHFEKRNLTVDHIVPRAKGGTDHIDNLWLLCGACNSSKGTKSQAEFLRDRMSLQGAGVQWLDQ